MIELWGQKVNLARDMISDKILPYQWIYDNIFNFSADEKVEIQNQIIDDQKEKFRHSQIEMEGNDPQQSGDSIGTPSDMASVGIGADDTATPPDSLAGSVFNPFGEEEGEDEDWSEWMEWWQQPAWQQDWQSAWLSDEWHGHNWNDWSDWSDWRDWSDWSDWSGLSDWSGWSCCCCCCCCLLLLLLLFVAAAVAVRGTKISHSIYNNSRSTAPAAVMLIIITITITIISVVKVVKVLRHLRLQKML